MKTISITKNNLDSNNFYKGEGVGRWDAQEAANLELSENLGTVHFKLAIYVKGYVYAKAGSGIEAGESILSGLSIVCKLILSCQHNIFAGTCWWKKATDEESLVICGELKKGTIAHGELKIVKQETPKVEKIVSLSGKTVSVTVDGKTYEAVIK